MPACRPTAQQPPTNKKAVWLDPAPLSEDVDVRVPPDEFNDLHIQSSDAKIVTGEKDANNAMSDGKNLPPARYVCHVCGVCIATGDAHQGDKADVLIFSRLCGSVAATQVNKAVVCPSCGSALGSRGDNNFLLRKGLVVKRQEKLEILVCSLKAPEIQEVTPTLQEAYPYCNVTPRVLSKAELRGFQLTATKGGPDMVVVVHRNEGRALLTDRNGFYHDVLASAWQITRGNVLVILTRTELKDLDAQPPPLFDAQLLQSLSTKGDQPTIGAISACGRVLTWETQPSKAQLQHLELLSEKAYFREPADAVQGIPVAWVKAPQKSSTGANANWCNLL